MVAELFAMVTSNKWGAHFELGYRDELDYAKAMIAEGEKNPSRILHKLVHRMRVMSRSSKLILLDGPEQKADLSRSEMLWEPKEFKGRRGLLPTGVDAFFDSSLMGHNITVPFYNDIKSAPGYFLSDTIKDQFDYVVDLGCGNGSTLFDLYRFGSNLSVKYRGGECSQSAVELINMLSELQDDFDLEAFIFDFREPDLDFVKNGQSVLYYTIRAVQVINPIEKKLFYALLDSAEEVQCIHFEPIGFQIDGDHSRISVSQKEFFQSQDWNMNLMDVLNELQDEGRIEITFTGKDIMFGGDALIPNSVIEWKKI